MKFKGFFKEYWNMVCKPSFAWMRKYWLPFSICMVISCFLSFCYAWFVTFGLGDPESRIKRTDDEELEEFLR